MFVIHPDAEEASSSFDCALRWNASESMNDKRFSALSSLYDSGIVRHLRFGGNITWAYSYYSTVQHQQRPAL